ncbi:MAG: hypothetical protein ABSH08_11800 [Tepidisphaeraceae bacterium]|jgi:hypothetical protein
MTPQLYLILLLGILLVGVSAGGGSQFRCRRKLRACAGRWNMHFAPGDRLALARRIVGHFPVPGAASISVRDLLYRTAENRHQYLFTVDYTVGVIRGKVGQSRVAGFSEPVSRGGREEGAEPVLTLAPGELSGPAAYEHILQTLHFSRI